MLYIIFFVSFFDTARTQIHPRFVDLTLTDHHVRHNGGTHVNDFTNYLLSFVEIKEITHTDLNSQNR